jgi:8-oxo-dGTP diphosphatase
MNITNCVFGILLRDRKILLVKNLYKEFGPIWGIPGGKQELHESFQTTLIRECKEEVSLDIQVGKFVTIFERIQPLRPFHLVAPCV